MQKTAAAAPDSLVIRVTADTNIYVSAVNFGGLPLRFLELAVENQFELACSIGILEEITRVLALKFAWPAEDVQRLELLIRSICSPLRVPGQKLSVIADDPADNIVLECALDANSHYIVSGDKHLLKVGTYGQMKILKVADFLHILSGTAP